MRYKEKEKIKETALQLYLQGKNFTQIAKEIGTSRNYISSLLKADLEKMQCTKTLKVYKNNKKKHITIGIEALEQIGISKDSSVIDYIDVLVDKDKKRIILTKHNN